MRASCCSCCRFLMFPLLRSIDSIPRFTMKLMLAILILAIFLLYIGFSKGFHRVFMETKHNQPLMICCGLSMIGQFVLHVVPLWCCTLRPFSYVRWFIGVIHAYEGFHRWYRCGYAWIINLNRIISYKPSILGYSWVPSFAEAPIYIYMVYMYTHTHTHTHLYIYRYYISIYFFIDIT